ncbi:hypothetical protein [Novosphingobium capsulatum]|uniref:hypothetical protein n=1 Tax=Novosphingobium capsulatum TaxID=13688 RepID=UPI002E0E1654|nr:hypothetical protein U0041_03925 [Novosphingobium capsulatum]
MSDDPTEITPLEKAYSEALTAARQAFVDALAAEPNSNPRDFHVGLMCTLMGEVTHVLGSFPPRLAQSYIELFSENLAAQVALSRAERTADTGSTLQ